MTEHPPADVLQQDSKDLQSQTTQAGKCVFLGFFSLLFNDVPQKNAS